MSDNGQKSTDPPMSDLDRALEEFLSFEKNHNFVHGDIKRTSIKYRVNYDALQKRWSRLHHKSDKTTDGSVSRSSDCSSDALPKPDDPVNIHGSYWWNGSIPAELVQRLPWHGKGNRGWWGFTSEEVSLQAYKNGKVRIFPIKWSWRIACVLHLRKYGFTDEQIAELIDPKNLEVHGDELHVSVPLPSGVPKLPEESSLDGIIRRYVDGSPWGKSLEWAYLLQKYFERLDTKVDEIPKIVGAVMGGMRIDLVVANTLGIVEKLSERVSALERSPPSGAGEEPHSPSASTGSSPSVTKPQAIGRPLPAPGSGEPSFHQPTARQEVSSRTAEGSNPSRDPSAMQMMAQDLGYTIATLDTQNTHNIAKNFAQGYRQDPLPVAAAAPPAPAPARCPLLQLGFRDYLHCVPSGTRATLYADGEERPDAYLKRPLLRDFCLGGWERCPYFIFERTGSWDPSAPPAFVGSPKEEGKELMKDEGEK